MDFVIRCGLKFETNTSTTRTHEHTDRYTGNQIHIDDGEDDEGEENECKRQRVSEIKQQMKQNSKRLNYEDGGDGEGGADKQMR